MLRRILAAATGSSAAALIGLATLAINGRSLGPELLGVLALLQAFIGLCTRLYSFDTWQPVITLGARAMESGDAEHLRDVAALGFATDLLSALLALASALALLLFGATAIGLSSEHYAAALTFICWLPLNFSGASTGLLRLWGHFWLISAIQFFAAASALLAALVLAATDAPFSTYCLVFAALLPLAPTGVNLAALIVWRRKNLPELRRLRLNHLGEGQRFFAFSWSTWALSSINALRQNADLFTLGLILGPAASGAYKLASQLASIITRVAEPISQVLYPEIAQAAATKQLSRLSQLVAAGWIIGMAVALIVIPIAILISPPLIALVGGEDFRTGAGPLAWLLVANAVALNHAYIRPAYVSLFGPTAYLIIFLWALAAFLPLLVVGIPQIGIAAAGAAQLAFNVIWLLMSTAALRKRLDLRWNDLRLALNVLVQRAQAAFRRRPISR